MTYITNHIRHYQILAMQINFGITKHSNCRRIQTHGMHIIINKIYNFIRSPHLIYSDTENWVGKVNCKNGVITELLKFKRNFTKLLYYLY